MTFITAVLAKNDTAEFLPVQRIFEGIFATCWNYNWSNTSEPYAVTTTIVLESDQEEQAIQ